MRISRMLKRMVRPGRSQQGFSIPEVLIAGILLTLVSMPMMNMFNTSIQMSRLGDDFNKVQVCVRSYSEVVRALPFYRGYTGTNQDVDDFVWGDGRGIANDWSTAPEVLYKDYGTASYPQFKVTVKMVYLTDTLADATMKSNWGPKKTSYDKPTDNDNNLLHMIKYEVKAYWQSSLGGERNFSTAAIRTDSEGEVGLLISSCLNKSAVLAKHGSKVGMPDDNTTPHTVDSIDVEISGKGFKNGGDVTSVRLAMNLDTDITVTFSAATMTDTLIKGTFSLSTGGKAGLPWSPRRMPGGWTVMVFKDKAFAALMDGFIVEFPAPTLKSVAPSSGTDDQSNYTITVTGDTLLSLPQVGGYNKCQAALRLIYKEADGNPDTSRIVDAIAGSTTNGTPLSTASYTTTNNTISARFDLTGKTLGEYYLWVVNCKDYSNLGQLGDVTGSSQNATAGAFVFRITKAPPGVSSVYVTDSSPNQSYGFNNRSYNLTIKGVAFDDSVDPGHGVTVYMGRPNAAPNTPRIAPVSNLVVVDGTTIKGDFDLSGLAGNEGPCWVWVQNNYYMQSGSKANAYEVRRPPRVTAVTNVDADARVLLGGTFKYNYYDIGTQLTGQDFYSGYQVYYQKSGTGGSLYRIGANGLFKYPDEPAIPPADGEAAAAYVNSTTFTGDLNLIGLTTGTYNIWVADPNDYLNAAGSTFNCVYGKPILLTEATSNVVTIRSRRSSNTYQSTETASATAFARRAAQVKFMLTGMGFLDPGTSSTTTVLVGTTNNLTGDYTAVINRPTKSVVLYTVAGSTVAEWNSKDSGNFPWTVPSSSGTFNIVLTNNNGSGSTTHSSRWRITNGDPPAW